MCFQASSDNYTSGCIYCILETENSDIQAVVLENKTGRRNSPYHLKEIIFSTFNRRLVEYRNKEASFENLKSTDFPNFSPKRRICQRIQTFD